MHHNITDLPIGQIIRFFRTGLENEIHAVPSFFCDMVHYTRAFGVFQPSEDEKLLRVQDNYDKIKKGDCKSQAARINIMSTTRRGGACPTRNVIPCTAVKSKRIDFQIWYACTSVFLISVFVLAYLGGKPLPYKDRMISFITMTLKKSEIRNNMDGKLLTGTRYYGNHGRSR